MKVCAQQEPLEHGDCATWELVTNKLLSRPLRVVASDGPVVGLVRFFFCCAPEPLLRNAHLLAQASDCSQFMAFLLGYRSGWHCDVINAFCVSSR